MLGTHKVLLWLGDPAQMDSGVEVEEETKSLAERMHRTHPSTCLVSHGGSAFANWS